MVLNNISGIRQISNDTSHYGQKLWSLLADKINGWRNGSGAKNQDLAINIKDDVVNVTSVTDTATPNTSPVKNPPNPCSDPSLFPSYSASAGPLVQYTWGQFETYNEACPNLGCTVVSGDPNAVTGCVPTAGAMIFAYWAHNPVTTYSPPLTNTTYTLNYSAMPTTSGNSDVQTLMAIIGGMTNSTYGCGASGNAGTGTNPAAFQSVVNAMIGFPYPVWAPYNSSSMTCYDSITADFNAKMPICFSANDPVEGGHFWVCDGYSSSWGEECYAGTVNTFFESYFHMNWGWHEIDCNAPNDDPDYNGYYDYDNWIINGAGPAAEPNLNFQYAEWVVKEIAP